MIMHKIRFNFKTIFVILSIILELLLTNLPESHATFNVSFTEDLDGMIVFTSIIDRKGTILLRLIRGNTLDACNYTDEPRIHLRVILSTGEVHKIDLPKNTLNILPPNFCPDDYLYFYLLEPNYIIFTFYNFDDQIPLRSKSYDETGVVLSYTGEIVSTFSLGRGTPLNETITVSLDPKGGFMRTFIWPNGTITWTKFTSPDEQRTIYKLGEGILFAPTPQEIVFRFNAFSLIDGGYGCAIVTNQTIRATNTSIQTRMLDETTWTAYVTFLWDTVNTPSQLFILYQTSIPWETVKVGTCRRAYDGTGFACFLKFQLTGLLPLIYSVHFLSQGSVTSIRKLRNYNQTNFEIDTFYNVFAGGYVVIGVLYQGDQATLIGNFYNTSGSIIETINIGDDNYYKVNNFPNNNSLFYANIDRNDTKTWRVGAIPLPPLKHYDERYSNPNINSTTPTIDEVIELHATSLSITYNSKVVFGSGNTSIYQKLPNGDLLREQTSYEVIEYLPDSGYTKVLITAIRSTFNVPSATYYVEVGANFVQLSENKEPIYGIEPNIWTFKTGPYKQISRTEPVSGLIRLHVNGSAEFVKAYKSYGYSIMNNLANQIASIIPVSPNQIHIRDAYQYDQNTPPRVLLRMDITHNASNNEQDVPQIIEDFTILLENMKYTQLSRENYTSWLDNTYNFQITANLWSRYKTTIIIGGTIFCAVITIYLYAVYRNKNARNFVIITVALIVQDFFFDVLFVIKNGRDFDDLFLPCVLTFIIPIIFNTVMASFILLSENSREDKFNDWFRKYPQVAAVFTLAACADVDILNVLSSRVGGLMIFSAVYSNRAELMIFRAVCLNLLIEDLPQFIIRVIYWRKNITYNVLPTIALISAGVSLLTTVVGRLYQGIIRCNINKRETLVGLIGETISLEPKNQKEENG
ncbi:11422_t:CDS:10, partial [Ambispora gerdemannii]